MLYTSLGVDIVKLREPGGGRRGVDGVKAAADDDGRGEGCREEVEWEGVVSGEPRTGVPNGELLRMSVVARSKS